MVTKSLNFGNIPRFITLIYTNPKESNRKQQYQTHISVYNKQVIYIKNCNYTIEDLHLRNVVTRFAYLLKPFSNLQVTLS